MSLLTDKPLAVINCGELVTLAGPARPRIRNEMKELSILRDAAMLIRGGKIERIDSRTGIQLRISPPNTKSWMPAVDPCFPDSWTPIRTPSLAALAPTSMNCARADRHTRKSRRRVEEFVPRYARHEPLPKMSSSKLPYTAAAGFREWALRRSKQNPAMGLRSNPNCECCA